jgi:hypothetical protein
LGFNYESKNKECNRPGDGFPCAKARVIHGLSFETPL